MTKSGVAENEDTLIRLIRQCILENGEPPVSLWLSEHSGFSRSHVGNVIDRLLKKNLVERVGRRITLTQMAIDYLDRLTEIGKNVNPLSILPAVIRVRGQVKAGETQGNELEIDLLQDDEMGSRFITVPEVNSQKRTYALEVKGNSMEHEQIFEGDFVIVEEFGPVEWPRPNELIVTHYVPFYMEVYDFNEQLSDPVFFGPTLKYYHEKTEQGYFKLGWRNDPKNINTQAITATRLKPVGRVKGVYKPAEKFIYRGR